MSQYAQSSHGSAPPIGIDLGTTMSAVAVASRGSGIHTIRDAEGRLLTPSVVHLGQRVSVGAEALAREQTDPGEIADAFKRDMGKAHYHRKLRDYWTPPEVLSAFVLEKLRRDAERELGPVRSATIAVPAYFDEPRRQGTLAAGRLAGFEHVQIINEPTAAALAHFYSCGKRDHAGEFRFPDARIVVFDLGGGTLDVSVLQTEGNAFRTLATDGAVKLGGLDFDKCIVEFVASQFEQRQGFDPRTDPTAMRRLWRDAQEAKHSLSSKQRATVSCRVADLRLGVDLSREQFEQLIERYMVVALQTCQEALQRAGLTWGEVDDVLLVGGSSRVPMVARRMEELSGRKPLMVGSPDEAVAQGAAIFAATQVDGFLPPMEIVNVNAHSLGIAGIDVQTNQPINKILIPRNTPLPTSGQYRFVTKAAGQPAVTIRLLEGESENPKNCTTVAHCAIELESNLPARTEILVTCCYGSDGVISTSAFI
ncbi:MAG TPA: Hsp70 family protein, partial [Lacipirellulaceae bacterium]|nr:Hsp70 family protein [Lacipirellulaceae bacterium]